MIGTIKNVNAQKGYGFIRSDSGTEYFFHKSALKNVRIEDLERGREVTFEDVEGSKGLRAEDIYV